MKLCSKILRIEYALSNNAAFRFRYSCNCALPPVSRREQSTRQPLEAFVPSLKILLPRCCLADNIKTGNKNVFHTCVRMVLFCMGRLDTCIYVLHDSHTRYEHAAARWSPPPLVKLGCGFFFLSRLFSWLLLRSAPLAKSNAASTCPPR